MLLYFKSDTAVATGFEAFVWFIVVLWRPMWTCHELVLKVWELGEVGRDGKTSLPERSGLSS